MIHDPPVRSWAQNMSPKNPPFLSMVNPSEILMREHLIQCDPRYPKCDPPLASLLQHCILLSLSLRLSLSSTPLWMLLLHFSNPSFPKSTIIWQEGWPYCSSLLATGLCRKKNIQLVSRIMRAGLWVKLRSIQNPFEGEFYYPYLIKMLFGHNEYQ